MDRPVKRRSYPSIWRLILHPLLIIFLTVTTQVGGLLYSACLILGKMMSWSTRAWLMSYLVVHSLCAFVVIPQLAPAQGKVPLPVYSGDILKPANLWMVWSNRHYVTPELYLAVLEAGRQLKTTYPELRLVYLDASFPFGKRFPILPHRSHADGRALDLSFVYMKDGQVANKSRSWTGYGDYEEALPGYTSQAKVCKEAGFKQYSLTKIFGLVKRGSLRFDSDCTKDLIFALLNQPMTDKVFLEPHLSRRLGLRHTKLRFHGCHSVRHDDHIHWAVRS